MGRRLNKGVEGWQYDDYQRYECWSIVLGDGLYMRVDHNYDDSFATKWEYTTNKMDSWRRFPRHVRTLEARLAYAAVVCRLGA